MKKKLAAMMGSAAVGIGVLAAPAAAQVITAGQPPPPHGCGVGFAVSQDARGYQQEMHTGMGAYFHSEGGNPAQGIPDQMGTGIKAYHQFVKGVCKTMPGIG